MIPFAYVLLASATSNAPLPVRERVLQFAQMTIRQRIVIRVPALAPTVAAPAIRQIEWKEKRGPRCVAMTSVAGAAITQASGTQASSVDLVLRGGTRLRARLDDACPALDYYAGFYLSPTGDGQVCAGRDIIHTRAGGECAIAKFRVLAPRR